MPNQSLIDLVSNRNQPALLSDVRGQRDVALERGKLQNQTLSMQNSAMAQQLADEPVLRDIRARAAQGDQLAQIQLYSMRPEQFVQMKETLAKQDAGQREADKLKRQQTANQILVKLQDPNTRPEERAKLLPILAEVATFEQLSKATTPQTTEGKLNADLQSGLITQEQAIAAEQRLSKPGVTVNNNIGDKGFIELSKGMSKELLAQRQGAMDAAASLRTNEEAVNLLNSGAITGTGAEFLISAGKLLQRAGITSFDDPIANTEAFQAAMAQNVGRIIKLFGSGTGLSDADREYAQKAAAGQITLSEQSLRRIIDINDRASRNVITRYNALADQVQSRPEAQGLPFDLKIEAPTEQPSAAQPSGGQIKFLGFE